MLTREYLTLFRGGDYTLVLDWLTYLNQHYSPEKNNLEADEIIPVMIFELINHGFKKEDLIHVPVLAALLNQRPPIIPAIVAYGLTLFISAALQYQIFEENNLIAFYQTDNENFDMDALKKWMTRDNQRLNPAKNSAALQEKLRELDIQELSCQKQVELFREKILTIISYQNLCREYRDILSREEDKSAAIRLGVVRAMYDYLESHIIVTSQLIYQLTEYVNKIRELQPLEWEERYLRELSSKSLIQWLFASQKLRFFAFKMINNFLPIANDEIKSIKGDY